MHFYDKQCVFHKPARNCLTFLLTEHCTRRWREKRKFKQRNGRTTHQCSPQSD